MTDLSTILPTFSTDGFTHLIAPLERAGITTSELLCAQPVDIAKKAQVPPSGVAKLVDALVKALHADLDRKPSQEWSPISSLNSGLDEALGGGIPAGYLTEITGER
jgi:DNA repair protein RAD57